jgi:hypothetical protein
MKTKHREVEELSSCGVESTSREVGGRRSVTLRLSTLDCSTRIRMNEPGMSMKTKKEVKKSRSATPKGDRILGAAPWEAAGLCSTSRLRNFWTPEFNERTGNVYENKGRGQKVMQSGASRSPCTCPAPFDGQRDERCAQNPRRGFIEQPGAAPPKSGNEHIRP